MSPVRAEGRMPCGKWQDVLADIKTCEAVIMDPPYSARTHVGQRTGSRPRGGGGRKSTIEYMHISELEIQSTSIWLSNLDCVWSVIFSDHHGARLWESGLLENGLYVFAPVVWAKQNGTPRFSGDGPTSGVEYLIISRKKARLPQDCFGSRPGCYLFPANVPGENVIAGGKPIGLMKKIILDYSRPGGLVVDLYAGGGTTLLAAAIEGRRAIGAEMDPRTFDLAVARLAGGYTPRLVGLQN